MSEKTGRDFNPYAPPESEVVQPYGSSETLRKPTSTKWALAVFFVKLVVINAIHWSIAQQDGVGALFEMYQEDLVSLIAPVTSLLGFIGLIILGRSSSAYILASLALIVLCNDGILYIWRELRPVLFKLDMTSGILEMGVPVVIGGLLLYLACRFIFGLPSRRYYGLVQKQMT